MASDTPSVPKEQGLQAKYTTVSITAISDTHSMHSRLKFDTTADADILIHAGDITNRGTREELEEAIDWLASLPFKHKILIAGNHDIGLDKFCTYRASRVSRLYPTPKQTDEIVSFIKKNKIIYLTPEHPSVKLCVRDCTVRIFGLPYAPYFHIGSTAFMKDRAENTWADVRNYKSYDILLAHSPPKGILDKTRGGEDVGCDHFLAAIKRVKPQAVIFGHIHEARGMATSTWDDGTSTLFYNVANLSLDGKLHPPTSFSIKVPNSRLPRRPNRQQ